MSDTDKLNHYAYACLNASQWLPLGGDDMVRWYLNVATIVEPHVESSWAMTELRR